MKLHVNPMLWVPWTILLTSTKWSRETSPTGGLTIAGNKAVP